MASFPSTSFREPVSISIQTKISLKMELKYCSLYDQLVLCTLVAGNVPSDLILYRSGSIGFIGLGNDQSVLSPYIELIDTGQARRTPLSISVGFIRGCIS